MPSGTEQEALEAIEAIEKLCGEATIRSVASKVGIEISYARMLCNSLGRADYINLSATEVCRITPKGKSEIKTKGHAEPSEHNKDQPTGLSVKRYDKAVCNESGQASVSPPERRSRAGKHGGKGKKKRY